MKGKCPPPPLALSHFATKTHNNKKKVFEYSFHQLRVRNAEEMRGRLHITFQNEDGIDAGGLTREW